MKRSCFTSLVILSLLIGCGSSHKLMQQAEESGNYGLLRQLALERVKKNTKDAYALAMLGRVYLFRGVPDSAVYYYNRAHRFHPENLEYRSSLIEAKIALGDTLLKRGMPLRARENFQQAIDLDSSHFVALCRMGLVQKQLGLYDEAKLYYRKAFRVNEYADTLQKILDFFDAAHVQSNLLMKKGLELLDKKNYQAAMKTLKQSVAAKPDNQEAKYYSYLATGLYYYKRGSLGKLWNAIEAFGRAASLRPEAPEPHFYMAEAYIKKDDKDFANAIRELEEVIKLAPESQFARQAQKKIDQLRDREKLLKDFWKK